MIVFAFILVAMASFGLGSIVGFKAYGKGLKRAVQQGRLKMELYW